jgi:hypothetical protein
MEDIQDQGIVTEVTGNRVAWKYSAEVGVNPAPCGAFVQ